MYSSDNGNGTFTNPVLLSDYADCDIIRVEEDYYMVSSSMNRMPGIGVLHSKDLVNWEIIGYAYHELKHSPAYDMKEGRNAYRGGPWAPCIRYNKRNAKFYICATANAEDEGFMVFTSNRPEGPYDVTVLGGWIFDPGMLIDDDGGIYVYYGRDEIKMVELSPDGKRFLSEPIIVHRNEYKEWMEGTHAYKVNGYYYLSCTICGRNAKQVVLRSKHPEGPFEAKVVMDNGANLSGSHSHQGGIVDTVHGEWWYFLFQDRDYIGRCPTIQPLTWIEDWPIPGDPLNGFQSVSTWKKPVQGYEPYRNGMERSDEFDGDKIGLNWQWNHNPDNGNWSLTERKGWLRIRAAQADHILQARNMLTQKIVGWECGGTVKLDVRNLQVGDVAGLCMTNFDKPYGLVAVERTNQGYRVKMVRDDRTMESITLADPTCVHLKCLVDKHAESRFYYSADGENFLPIGDKVQMLFTIRTFLGYVFGLFCYSKSPSGGYADFDFFHLESAIHRANHFSAFQEIDAYRYDGFHDVSLEKCARYHYGENICSIGRGSHIRFDHIDFGDGADWFEMNVASGGFGGTIDVYQDHIYGNLIGTLEVPNTGGWQNWTRIAGEVRTKVTGVQRVYLHFTNKEHKDDLFHLDWFRFYQDPDS